MLARLARPLYYRLYRTSLRLRFFLEDHVRGHASIPPALLRFRVGEETDVARYLAIGENACDDIQAALSRAGRPLDQFRQVLDFGCGSGRIAGPMFRRFPQIRFHGTDVDASAIEWAGSNLTGVTFRSNGPLPPLPYGDGEFDLVYGVSVFTHLSDEHQRQWLPELKRVIRPGGVLLLTAHGESVWRDLSAARRERVERAGHLFETSAKLRGLVPDWYHTAYHTEAYLRALISTHFEVLLYAPAGLGYQDVVVAERRS